METNNRVPDLNWGTYDAIKQENDEVIQSLEEEHASKNWLQRKLGQRALRREVSELRIETADSFIDTLRGTSDMDGYIDPKERNRIRRQAQ